MSWKLVLPICVGILLLAAGITALIFSTEPSAQRGGATKRTAMLVEVTTVTAGDHTPTIVALGVVRPAREIVLAPRVDGEIVALDERFTPGGRLPAGEPVVELDPRDYEIRLTERQTALQQAQADLAIAEGQYRVAQRDYEVFDEELSPERKRLALREPQLESAQASVRAAEAAVERAELDLERTRIAAPFDALVLERHVELGSQVAAGEPLARLVGTDAYWVETTVPLKKLAWIAFPGPEEDGAPVTLRNRTAWPAGVTRSGRVHRLVGALNDRTRLARVLVTVAEPLGAGMHAEPGAGDSSRPPLLVGEMLEVRITGRPLQGVIKLDRELVRSGDTVWEMHDGTLKIREVAIAFRDEDHAYITEGLTSGARVVTTDLATVVDGAALRLNGDTPTTDADQADEGGD